MAEAKRILIIKPSSMGDVVHALPVLSALRRAYPDAHIAWVVSRACAGALAGNPCLNETIIFERQDWIWGKLWSGVTGLVALIRQLRRGNFDLAIDLQGLFRTGLMTRLSGAPVRMGFANARELAWMGYNHKVQVPHAEIHAVDRYLLCVRALGLDVPAEPEFVLPMGFEDASWADRFIAGLPAERGPVVLVNPAGRWTSKRWPSSGFAKLADELVRRRNAVVVFTGGPEDGSVVGRVRAEMTQRSLDLAGKTSLGQFTALLRRADLLVCNDSGPMHLAAAVQAPVLAFFGPTNPVRTGPYGDPSRCTVLWRHVECSPCYRRECKTNHCMEAIGSAEALAAAEALLEAHARERVASRSVE